MQAMSRGKKPIEEQQHKELERCLKFGEVRPAIHADYRGYKVVAVGNEVHWSKHWRTFPDSLQDYIKSVVTPEWGKAELAKPFDDRHQIMKWYDAMCRYQQKQKPGPDGLYGTIPNGLWRAYLLLSHDLYTLRHHSALQTAVVARLKHKDQFQGARHELFAAATCIRAGYDIEYEDEGDNSRRHPELIAKHRATGQQIAVEAKSRHRPGVLGFAGPRQPTEPVLAGIERLLTDALAKPASYPYVIFFDLNLPPSEGHLFTKPWCKEVLDSTTEIADQSGENDPFSLIVFSSFPDHYGEDDSPAPVGDVLSVLGRNPKNAPSHPKAIMAIHEAANKFGVIPTTFDEAG